MTRRSGIVLRWFSIFYNNKICFVLFRANAYHLLVQNINSVRYCFPERVCRSDAIIRLSGISFRIVRFSYGVASIRTEVLNDYPVARDFRYFGHYAKAVLAT